MLNVKILNQRSADIHQSNVDAGWWSNLKTGESILETRNRPEVMDLVISELSEASEGFHQNAHDDKLTDRPMAEVELADAAIRLHDLLGAEKIEFHFVRPAYSTQPISFNDYLMEVVNDMSFALEGYRKTDREKYAFGLLNATAKVYDIGRIFCFDVNEALEAKLAYNKNRADHKPENRLKDGGKKI